MNSKFYELTKSESKVNKYKELTSIVNENTFEFQKTYPFLFNLFETTIRGNLDDGRFLKDIIFKTPKNYELFFAFLYQLYFFYTSKYFFSSKAKTIILSLPGFNSLTINLKKYLLNKSFKVLDKKKTYSFLDFFSSKFILFSALGLPICRYKKIKKIFISKNFLLTNFDEKEVAILDNSENKIKKHIFRLSKIYRYRNIQAIFTTGSTSYSTSSLCLAAKKSQITYTVLAHGYISNPELITIAPIRSNYLILWTKYQANILKEKVEDLEKHKLLYFGYPGDKIMKNKSKVSRKILFALEPIDKLVKTHPFSLKATLYLYNKLKDEFECFFRPHPKDSLNYMRISKILDVNLESLSNCSLNKDLSVAKVVVSTNSSVLIQANLNNIHAFQIKEGVRPVFDGVPCYDIKTLLSIIPKVINEEKTPINVDFLNENLDKLEKILFNT